MLILDKFEEAAEIVKRVTQETNWYIVTISAARQETKFI